MNIRKCVYLAGDFDSNDREVIKKIQECNRNLEKKLKFKDAHELTQARDESLPCSIKTSLAKRLDESDTFVLVVGEKTNNLTKGSCQHCGSYSNDRCYKNHNNVSFDSFIKFECKKALKDNLRIVVIYNSLVVDRSKCPEVIRYTGTHIPAIYNKKGDPYWNYLEIRNAIMNWGD